MKDEFLIPKFDNKGSKVRTAAGEPVYTTFVYNFNELNMSRKLAAQKFFELAEKQLEMMPQTQEQIDQIATRQLEEKAFSAILIRITDEERQEIYDPLFTRLSKYELNEFGKTEDEWARLQAVKADFFTKIGITSRRQMTESINTIMPLMRLVQGLRQEGVQIQSTSEIVDVWNLITGQTSDTLPSENITTDSMTNSSS